MKYIKKIFENKEVDFKDYFQILVDNYSDLFDIKIGKTFVTFYYRNMGTSFEFIKNYTGIDIEKAKIVAKENIEKIEIYSKFLEEIEHIMQTIKLDNIDFGHIKCPHTEIDILKGLK